MNNLIWKGFCKKPGMPKGGYWYVFRCLYCQKPFVAPGYEVNAGRMTKYCSNECSNLSDKRIKNLKKSLSKIDTSGKNNPNYKDGGNMYIKFRKDFCELCGRSSKNLMNTRFKKRNPLLVHHCDMNRRNSDPNNLKTVCFSCHMRIHNPSYFGKYPEFQRW